MNVKERAVSKFEVKELRLILIANLFMRQSKLYSGTLQSRINICYEPL